jgi:hypothetical protein
MQPVADQLRSYLHELTGSTPALTGLPTSQMAGFPLFLRDRYQLAPAELFGKTWLLAMEQSPHASGSAQEYLGHQQRFQEGLGGQPVALVLPSINPWTRNRLIQAGVPFIVPDSQLFLPPLAVDLRERGMDKNATLLSSDRPLTPTAQLLVLFHLTKQPVSDLPLQAVARKLACTAMMISKAKEELVRAGLCETTRRDRFLHLVFPERRRDLWDRARPYLRTPVLRENFVRWRSPPASALEAGLTALSHRTLMSDDALPTWAVSQAIYRSGQENGSLETLPEPYGASARLQSWRYAPNLTGDGSGVDPLSLYLSLHDSPADRVRAQADILLENFPW